MSNLPAELYEASCEADRKPEGADQPWHEAQPLHRELPAADPFPVDALGSVLGGAQSALERIIQAPAATTAHSLLAAAALATQAHADVEIDGRCIPLSLFLVSILESGGRKSATDRVALAPHFAFERVLAERFREAFVAYEASLAAWEKTRDQEVRRNTGKEAKEGALLALGSRPSEPVHPQMLTEEPTYEGIVKYLAVGRPSLGIFSDEGGRFLGGHAMNEENRLKTLSGLSGLWDGTRVTRTRAGDGSVVLLGRRVSLHVMVQPVVAPTLLGDPLAREQGFLARCLVSWPESTLGFQAYVPEDPAGSPQYAVYHRRMLELLDRPLPTSEQDPRELHPRSLRLAPPAKEAWTKFHDWVQKNLRSDGAFRPVAALAAKAAEHVLRLAGVVALVEEPDKAELELTHVEAGIVLARFYLAEALRLNGLASTDGRLRDASRLLTWLRSRGRLVSLPDVYQYGPSFVRDKASARRLMGVLEEHGWTRGLQSGAVIDGVRRRDVWEVRRETT